jgi:hypothetical protein
VLEVEFVEVMGEFAELALHYAEATEVEATV